jgi:hypothetical protein
MRPVLWAKHRWGCAALPTDQRRGNPVQEMGGLLRKMGVHLEDDKFQSLIAAIDVDNDGEITFIEFLQVGGRQSRRTSLMGSAHGFRFSTARPHLARVGGTGDVQRFGAPEERAGLCV